MSRIGKLEGKVAIVTGGSRGIGREVCITLAAQGASVVVDYTANAKAADDVVDVIKKAGGKAIAVKADVADAAEVKNLFDKAEEAFGRVDILAHLAGVSTSTFHFIVDTTEEEWDEMFHVNTKGTFVTNKEAAKRFGPGSRIVNTSTVLTRACVEGYAAYTASKAAIEGFSITLAKELRGKKVTVNCVAPSGTVSDMFYAGRSEENIEMVRMCNPLERLGHPRDIASIILFLVSNDGEWVNGQVIHANGGQI